MVPIKDPEPSFNSLKGKNFHTDTRSKSFIFNLKGLLILSIYVWGLLWALARLLRWVRPRHGALPYSHLLANFWNRIGYWLLNKLIKQTFNWRKKYFFLELYHRFHYKFVIKSLIFKIFFSGWFALCLHLPFTFTACVRDQVASSVLNNVCGTQ